MTADRVADPTDRDLVAFLDVSTGGFDVRPPNVPSGRIEAPPLDDGPPLRIRLCVFRE